MEKLPDELIALILGYLKPHELVKLQRVSSRLLNLARDNTLWRSKCFDGSPSAITSLNSRRSGAPVSGVPRPIESGETPGPAVAEAAGIWKRNDTRPRDRGYARARAIADWDLTDESERVDWYSEYIARHATLSATWVNEQASSPQEVRGLAISKDSTRAFGPLENGALCVWDIGQMEARGLRSRRTFREVSRSPASILFENRANAAEPTMAKAVLELSGPTECIAVDSDQQKAYVAVGNILNEVDLETLQVVSQNYYAWPITALSQEDSPERPLTVGTSWSLHMHDPRMRFRERSRSPEDVLKGASTTPEDSIAFLPNYTKGIPRKYDSSHPSSAPVAQPAPTSSLQSQSIDPAPGGLPAVTSSFGFGPQLPTSHMRHRSVRRRTLYQYAQVEPGPLSILHQGRDNIFIAGRFPSILSYDRRYFPKLQYVIHSGARLAALATLPYPPCRAAPNGGIEATLLACGEYNGRGSLEVYSLPHLKHNTSQGSSSVNLPEALLEDTTDAITPEAEQALSASMKLVGEAEPYNYKNRQAASPAKLLSVASQGTRIVFSDAEGGMRWVERDGSSLVRRWNVNSFEMHGASASVHGEQVVRKIIPVDPPNSDRGAQGDGDLLVWTGEKVGVITTRQLHDGVDVDSDRCELSKAFDESSLENDGDGDGDGDGDVDTKAENYARVMRRALERQADERRWMSRFNMRYR